jgi:hypothetical protein
LKDSPDPDLPTVDGGFITTKPRGSLERKPGRRGTVKYQPPDPTPMARIRFSNRYSLASVGSKISGSDMKSRRGIHSFISRRTSMDQRPRTTYAVIKSYPLIHDRTVLESFLTHHWPRATAPKPSRRRHDRKHKPSAPLLNLRYRTCCA